MSNTELPISGPLNLGELLDRAFRLYRAQFRLLWVTAMLFMVPVAILSMLYNQVLLGLSSGLDVLNDLTLDPALDATAALASSLRILGGSLLLLVITLLVTGFLIVTLTTQVIAVLRGRPTSIPQSLRQAARRYSAFLGMSILKYLVLVLITSVVACTVLGGLSVVTFGVGRGEVDVLFASIFLAVICGYGLVILLVSLPYLFLSARWVAATPGIVDQNWGAVQALSRSWDMTKGHTWRCVGYLVLLGLLTFLVFSLPTLVIQQVLFVLLPVEWFGVVAAASTALSNVFQALWLPLQTAAIVLLYYDLRVRQEDYHLELQIERLEQEILTLAATDGDVDEGQPVQ